MRSIAPLLLLVVLALVSTGCGLTGGTSTFRVDVKAPAGAATPALEVASVDLEPGQTRLANVGTYAWGEYDADDLEVLRTSMRQSLPAAPTVARHRIHVLVRRFLVAHSNKEGL